MAMTAIDGGRDNNPIAYFQIVDLTTDLDNFTHELVTDDDTLLHGKDDRLLRPSARAEFLVPCC